MSTSPPATLPLRRPHGPVRLGVTLAVAGAMAVVVAACGSNKPAAPASSGGGAANANATKVTVTETEFAIALSQNSFTAGTYEFAVDDKGRFPHNLVINGPGVANVKIPDGSPLGAGQAATGTVTLQKGSYELYCGVPGHKAKGMDMTITVS